jgi:uncharacterized protein (TIGR03435 family)
MAKGMGCPCSRSGIIFVFLIALMLVSPVLALSQTSSPLSFEVASIKPAEDLTAEKIVAGKMHLGITIDGARVDIGYLSVGDLIPFAFKLKPYQVAGPDWMKSGQRFDILAKLPEGATKEQAPEMLQTLLAERFHMKFHRETRELPVYALVVAKGGHKLKEAQPTPETPANAEASKGGMTLNAGGQKIQVNPSQGGATISSPESGTIKMSMDPETRQINYEFGKISMAQFAELLTRMVDRPVFDKTDLKGDFQVALNLSLENLMVIARSSGINIPLPPSGPANTASDPTGSSSIFSTVQQLGLRLEQQKAPVEFIVVDQLDKTPTEN